MSGANREPVVWGRGGLILPATRLELHSGDFCNADFLYRVIYPIAEQELFDEHTFDGSPIVIMESHVADLFWPSCNTIRDVERLQLFRFRKAHDK